MKKHLTGLSVLAVLGLSACAGQSSTGGGTSDVLIFATTQAPRHLNPAVQSGFATGVPGAQLFASPVRFEDSFDPQPYLAESWEISEDGKTVTLDLVDDAVFHDGEPITSEDVKFSLNVVKNEHPFGRSLYGPVESVDTPDEQTVVINLSQPHPALMIAMSPSFLPVLPEHVYGTDDTVADHPQNSQDVVGSGPYTLAEHQEGKRITLEKFDDFFLGDGPILDTVIMEVIPDESTLALALEKGEVHMAMSQVPSVIERLKANDQLEVADEGYEALGSISWLGFNTESERLSDKRVRQAIAYATDTEYIINDLHRSFTSRAPSPIHPDSPFFDDDLPTYERDLAKAAQLLDEAGYEEQADGTRLALTIDSAPGVDEMGKAVAETIKANLAEVGIAVTVRTSADFPTWATRVSNYDYDMTMDNVYNWGDPVVGVERSYRCDNIVKGVVWSNMSQYCNEEVDALFAEAAQATDEAERTALYGEVQQILADELPVFGIETMPLRNAYLNSAQNAPNGIFGMISPLLETTVGG